MNRSISLVLLFLLILPVGGKNMKMGEMYISDVEIRTIRSGPAPEITINIELKLYTQDINYDNNNLRNCGIKTDELIFYTDTGIYNTSDQLFATCMKDTTFEIYNNISYFGSLRHQMKLNVGFDILNNVTMELTQQTGRENITRTFTFSDLWGHFREYTTTNTEVIDQVDGDWVSNHPTEQELLSYIEQNNATTNDLIATDLRLSMLKDNYKDITLLTIDASVVVDNQRSDRLYYDYLAEIPIIGLKMKYADNVAYLNYSKIQRAMIGILKMGSFSTGISKVDITKYIAIADCNQTVLYDGEYILTPIQNFWISGNITIYSTKMTISNGEISLSFPFMASTSLNLPLDSYSFAMSVVVIITITKVKRTRKLE